MKDYQSLQYQLLSEVHISQVVELSEYKIAWIF